MTLRYILDPSGPNELILTEDEIFSHNPVRTHTGLSDLSATIVENRNLDAYVQRQDRLNVEVDGNVVWAGYLISLSHNIGEGRSRLRADGIAKRLKETRPDYDSLGGSLTYSSISLEDAIDDYWARTPFSNFSVTPQSTETVATDTTLQSADTTTEWNNLTSFSSTKPAEISNGKLQLKQTSFIKESENLADKFVASTQTKSDASGGEADFVNDSVHYIEADVTIDYTIPAGDALPAFRIQPGDASEQPAYQVSIDGTVVEDATTNVYIDTDWRYTGTISDAPELSPGTHTLRFDITANSTNNKGFYVDVVNLRDTRFNYTVSSSVNSDGYLDGPENFPKSLTTQLPEEKASFNITEGTIELTIDDTSNNQKIAISFDSGASFTSASNTNTLTTQPSSSTRTALVELTLSRHGSRSTASPATGYLTQSVDVYELSVDGNDLVVIDELNLSRNHFENLQQLHSYGGNWNWTIEHDDSDIANMTVVSYQQGDETRSKPSGFEDPISESAEVQAEAYFNSIYLQGALDSSGDRPIAEVDDQTAISNDGRVISPGVLRDPKITTEAGAGFRARALLETAQSNNELVGTKTLPSDVLINPGYQYPVDFGNGDVDKTLEEVSLSESPDDVNIRARFSTPRSDLSSQIEDLQRRARDQGDKL